MKVIIAGSRSISSYALLLDAVSASGFLITEVVCGGARGADMLGQLWAAKNRVPVRHFPANWTLYGRGAGFKRNMQMAEYADGLIALWDGSSPGTRHMIAEAGRRGLKVWVKNLSLKEDKVVEL